MPSAACRWTSLALFSGTPMNEKPDYAAMADDAYNALGVRLEESKAVLQLIVGDQGQSKPEVIAGALFALQTLLKSADDTFQSLGVAMSATQKQAAGLDTQPAQ